VVLSQDSGLVSSVCLCALRLAYKAKVEAKPIAAIIIAFFILDKFKISDDIALDHKTAYVEKGRKNLIAMTTP